MMYEVFVEQFFEAAHYLRGYQGKCENVHGHRYSVVVRLKSEKINEIGLVYDFTDIKQHLRTILGRYDHALLNDLSPFDKINPSAENIASTIYNQLMDKITDPAVVLSSVEVRENPHQGVLYTP
jgi:6-pyruvoyltetrahydropterin/6-carboxytetrahydropterin synthase